MANTNSKTNTNQQEFFIKQTRKEVRGMEVSLNPVFEKYERLCKNREGIERKLNRPNISADNKESLKWQLKNITRVIEEYRKQHPLFY